MLGSSRSHSACPILRPAAHGSLGFASYASPECRRCLDHLCGSPGIGAEARIAPWTTRFCRARLDRGHLDWTPSSHRPQPRHHSLPRRAAARVRDSDQCPPVRLLRLMASSRRSLQSLPPCPFQVVGAALPLAAVAPSQHAPLLPMCVCVTLAASTHARSLLHSAQCIMHKTHWLSRVGGPCRRCIARRSTAVSGACDVQRRSWPPTWGAHHLTATTDITVPRS